MLFTYRTRRERLDDLATLISGIRSKLLLNNFLETGGKKKLLSDINAKSPQIVGLGPPMRRTNYCVHKVVNGLVEGWKLAANNKELTDDFTTPILHI